MEHEPSQQDTEQTRRQDRLRGEIVAFVSDFNDEGYDNFEIARALIWAAYHKVRREPAPEHYDFMKLIRDSAQDGMDIVTAMAEVCLADQEKNEIN